MCVHYLILVYYFNGLSKSHWSVVTCRVLSLLGYLDLCLFFFVYAFHSFYSLRRTFLQWVKLTVFDIEALIEIPGDDGGLTDIENESDDEYFVHRDY